MNLNEVSWRPPRLETERLVLRGYESSDANAIYAYASDPDVTRYMSFDCSRQIDDIHVFLNQRVATQYQAEELSYAITLREAPEIQIGGIGLSWRPRIHRVMELGYILAKPHWGNGYVPEAARALMRHAFRHTDVARIFAPIFADNAKSRRVAEKMGLKFEGIQRSALEYRGRRWDEAFYAMLRGELD
ncbi:MAG TPA: GNAT family N-acetyltransferase [Polyangiaceae bacterium]|jgi:ribosomal-protein-alanine N-acetyltransferase|nr:GNAT family N-acetyltransferase [Polyangiaceae bacterium]